jgi:phage/plasmid-associated DNA primase
VELAVESTGNSIAWSQVDPWDKLNMWCGVLDLRTLRLSPSTGHYFRYRIDLSITQEEVDEVREGRYDIEGNEVYRLWRPHFDEENWQYFVHSEGTWLAPFRSKHLAFLIGPRDAGKSTLLDALTAPIDPIVGRTSLRSITDYTFGLQGLVGKQVNVYAERGEVALKNIDVINNLVGGRDFIEVHVKHRPPTVMRSLKAMVFAMNDPPTVVEYGGETMGAFLERLSIIHMRPPEGFKPMADLRVDPREAFKFLLWCRVKLEESGWVVRKMDEERMLDYLMEATNSALRFLESEWIMRDPSAKVKGTELYAAYAAWCREEGVTPMGRTAFYTTAASKHVKRVEEGAVWFRGIRLHPGVRGRGEGGLEGFNLPEA